MELNIGKEVATMKTMSVAELREKYLDVFGEPSRSRHKEFLAKRIAWRMQANVMGGLSERARERARELAADSDVRLTAPTRKPDDDTGGRKSGKLESSHDERLPLPGGELKRTYKGEVYIVEVLQDGFEYGGDVYGSLSAVAKAITGTHWNGYHFFGLADKGGANGKAQ